MIFRNVNLNRVFPGILAVGITLGATAAQAQVTAGNLTTPNAPAFGAGVTVVGSALGTLQAVPFALPVFGTPKTIQFTATGDIYQFNNLPASGSGNITGLTSVVNLTVNAVPISLNFSTEYLYNADELVFGLDGTRVTYNPTGAPTFVSGGSTYQVNLNATQSASQGTPTTLSNNTVTGSITNLTAVSSAPEPGTLVLAGLGIAGLAVRRRKH